MDAEADNPVAPTPTLGEVAEDRLCHQCGYNLRGLRTDGVCPECATPVAKSVVDPLLRYSPPAYVGRLRRGVQLISVGLSVFFWMFVLVLGFVVLFLVYPGASGPLSSVLAMLLPIAGLVTIVCLLLGTWLFTSPSPTVFAVPPEDRAARVARACLAIGLCGIALSHTVPALSPPMYVMALLEFARVGFGIVGVFGVRAYFQRVGQIAQRIPDKALAMDARNLAYVTTAILVVLVVVDAVHVMAIWLPVLLLAPATASRPAGRTILPGSVLRAVGMAKLFVVPLLTLGLLAQASKAITLHKRLRPLLHREWRAAEAFWREGSGPATPTTEGAAPDGTTRDEGAG